MKDFGDTVLLIKDNPKFLSLIEKALEKKRLKYFHELVQYYDKRIYMGKVDVFNKASEYAYQNEFRIYIRRKSDESLKIHIGSLKDIAEIYPANEFIDTFEATEKNNC
ncbi:hypothetical protein [Ferruginibacter albus]|uniref:hypothetical protein n=1 Tax=Ferruginibacter albus TaxID=2875540 RepID=UPI001CC5CFA9|nr:hypothetical protein [Ferruginibacter albus]UAY53228.1 hypothetical protein K9M53_06045 [Ferruginibacter albus]